MTFSAGTPPLQEALRLWDYLLAFGVHLNVLCVVSQLHLMKADLLTEPRCVALQLLPKLPVLTSRYICSPMKLLRSFPPLDAYATIALCCQFVKDLPADLYDQLACHVRYVHVQCIISPWLMNYLRAGMGFYA